MNMKRTESKSKTLLESLDTLIAEHHLLKHPFYQAWTEGKLSKESLQLYAEQYYQHVRAFPENLKELALRASGPLSALVEDNLAEELDPAGPHPMLWRQFAQSLGVSDTTLEDARPLPGIAALLDTFDELASQGTLAQAVAAFYAYEAQVPEIATQKISGLQRFYGITEPRALAYFGVHEEADVRHRAAWRGWLASQKDADAFAVLCAAERTLKALWGALDAVYPQATAAAAAKN
ncbi:MAG TPA: CADD family putative folate metabolism protein [Candidatus Acidoferrales bacterium]|nr:CADD family putative folate metabolism protein [Candidatus Acidoferrales bacterium]